MKKIRIAGGCSLLIASLMVFGCSSNPQGGASASGPSASGSSMVVPAGQHYNSAGVLVPDDQTAQAMPNQTASSRSFGPTSGPAIGPVGNRPPSGPPKP